MGDVPGAGPVGRDEVNQYIRIALYDTGGESVEGGFVDRWVPNAYVALDDLQAVLVRDGFLSQYEAQVREAVFAEDVAHAAAAQLLIWLKRWTRPLVEELLYAAQPHARAIGIAAAAPMLPPHVWLPGLRDASPEVRLAAVHAVNEQRRSVPDTDDYLLRALDDPDLAVSEAAAERIQFYRKPQIGAALVQHLAQEPRAAVRKALLLNMATELRRAGIHVQGATLEEGIGAPVRATLLRELDNDDPQVRQAIVSALERLRGEEVAARMLERLVAEQNYDVRAQLLMFNGYGAIAERALPVLAELLQSPTTTFRVRAAFLLEHFREAAVPLLLQALDDPDVGVRRAAAMSLGHCGNVCCLPRLSQEYANPAMHYARRELESAMRAASTRPPAPLTAQRRAQIAAAIEQRVDQLDVRSLSVWPLRLCRDELRALPLHGTLLFVWALQPDGTLLQIDHEAFMTPTEVEHDPLTRFAVLIAGARRYPELADLVPERPARVEACPACLATGMESYDGTPVTCGSCNGLGWRIW